MFESDYYADIGTGAYAGRWCVYKRGEGMIPTSDRSTKEQAEELVREVRKNARARKEADRKADNPNFWTAPNRTVYGNR